MRRIRLGTDLTGSPVFADVRRVKVHRTGKSNSHRSGVEGENIVIRTDDEEWAAWEQLPVSIRRFLSNMPVEQSVTDILEQWLICKRRGYGEVGFLDYLNAMTINYLNVTADVWPTPPLPMRELPKWPAS